jgi:hypothetical protein
MPKHKVDLSPLLKPYYFKENLPESSNIIDITQNIEPKATEIAYRKK